MTNNVCFPFSAFVPTFFLKQPSYDWQPFVSDSSFPAGLEYRLSLDGFFFLTFFESLFCDRGVRIHVSHDRGVGFQ